jgi:hypothetical protein
MLVAEVVVKENRDRKAAEYKKISFNDPYE